ncbi:uncharacterized protein LACBIDRAFT_296888 [Laccaria bicolor S238N-H82]|uniref:Predicted protein n=1 Tax=Laccaria bicolor (strain S238N-H82 / ATCC MYA-4686) TaxID=486041 RepID=B0D9H8_LACBS|nr:uncharacterized protein LACBIDRAFT_296888 [Laccaria bicolor S238N-H82]EDR08583.1 predicted protein [Laccaria bicolor S238N-H82]|eukprot:XP_001880808.1 predicted protein [Laccaria bicolor S238N-H82]
MPFFELGSLTWRGIACGSKLARWLASSTVQSGIIRDPYRWWTVTLESLSHNGTSFSELGILVSERDCLWFEAGGWLASSTVQSEPRMIVQPAHEEGLVYSWAPAISEGSLLFRGGPLSWLLVGDFLLRLRVLTSSHQKVLYPRVGRQCMYKLCKSDRMSRCCDRECTSEASCFGGHGHASGCNVVGAPTEKRATRYATTLSSFARPDRSASDMELNKLRIRLLASRRI